jgi:hypothetical protein
MQRSTHFAFNGKKCFIMKKTLPLLLLVLLSLGCNKNKLTPACPI